MEELNNFKKIVNEIEKVILVENPPNGRNILKHLYRLEAQLHRKVYRNIKTHRDPKTELAKLAISRYSLISIFSKI